MSCRPADDVVGLVEILGYEPVDRTGLAQAMAHRSWCAEHPGERSNERLEYLGDAILGFLVAEYVFRAHPELTEGELTDVRKAVVNAVTLADVASEVGLGDHVRLGKGEEASGGREKPSILSDATEALIGFAYVDRGMAAARELVLRLLGDRIEEAVATGGRGHDFKSRLQERVAHLSGEGPRYSFAASGPDHARQFTATVSVDSAELGTGRGRSKKQAEQQAARLALANLADLADLADLGSSMAAGPVPEQPSADRKDHA